MDLSKRQPVSGETASISVNTEGFEPYPKEMLPESLPDVSTEVGVADRLKSSEDFQPVQSATEDSIPGGQIVAPSHISPRSPIDHKKVLNMISQPGKYEALDTVAGLCELSIAISEAAYRQTEITEEKQGR